MGRIGQIIAALMALSPVPLCAAELPKPDALFPPQDMAQVRLGLLLFYDPILSGSGEVSCATCHHPRFGTSDGLSLGLGDGAAGLGPDRAVDPDNLPEERVPRNAPALFNLGATEFTRMFHDGRLEADPDRPGGIRTPLGEDMADGFASVLSAQSMFPVLAPDEMAGHYGESDVSRAVRMGLLSSEGGAWDIISARIETISPYRDAFDALLGAGAPIRFTDISDAIAAFIAHEWRADDSAFDRHIRGEASLNGAALAGMELFYGKAGCAMCHAGQFQTDHDFYAIAMPQIGPGKKGRFETHSRDTGRMRVTGRAEDAYRFRTPSLRNVTLTAPYGHDGAYATLEGVVRHHLDPVAALRRYDAAQTVLPVLDGAEDLRVLRDAAETDAIAAANELAPVMLSNAEVADIIAFLAALTDDVTRLGVPESVPSGLPVDQ
ncbi:MAG: cytochrome c peroxidase [Marinobacter sp.]